MILKPNCECCDRDLPAELPGAVVCSFECTFCAACAESLLGYCCPNCEGELRPRPRRPAVSLEQHPASAERVVKAHRCSDYLESAEVLRTATGTLHGSLLRPKNRPKAWALLISGSGPADRNSNQSGMNNNCLRYLALGLAARGVATLRYDKRGVAMSAAAGPSESSLTFDVFIEDAKDWLAALRLRATGPVSIVGHSEGAQIATRVAEKLSVASVVNLCGAGRPLHDILLAQLKDKLPVELYQKAEEVIAYLHELSLHEDHRKAKSKLLQRFSHSPLKAPNVPPELQAIFRPTIFPFYVSRMRERPDHELETLKCPVMLVSGSADVQVSESDFDRLCAAKPDARQLRLEGMNHVLKQVGDDTQLQDSSYFDKALPVDARLTSALAEFLTAR